jgi:hypothetical protein
LTTYAAYYAVMPRGIYPFWKGYTTRSLVMVSDASFSP